MNRKRFSDKYSYLCILCLTITLISVSCGGGGGGTSNSSPPPISYSGLTTQATISQDNATNISEEAYEGGTFAATLGTSVSVVLVPKEENRIGHSLPLELPQIFENSLNKINWESGKILAGAIISKNDTIPGNCGGSGSYSITVNDQTGDFTGQIIYNNYCEDNIIMSGGVGISGRININTLIFITLNFYFDGVTLTQGGISATIKGDVYTNVSGSTVTVTENLLLKDNTTNKVYWCKDYSLTVIKGVNYKDFTLSGTYYQPDYGYVTISTRTPFRVDSGYTTPSSGVLMFTGDGNTSALLTVLSSSTYHIQADTNGDTIYDWDSGTLYW